MAFNFHTEAPPLNEDATGALPVGNSRVLLEIVVRAFQDGATPETIMQRYSTLALHDVYAVLAYYLRIRTRSRDTWPDVSRRPMKFGNELRAIRAT